MLYNPLLLKMYTENDSAFAEIPLRFSEEADVVKCNANNRPKGKKGHKVLAPIKDHYTTWEGENFLIWRKLDKTLAGLISSGGEQLHHYTTTTVDNTYAVYLARYAIELTNNPTCRHFYALLIAELAAHSRFLKELQVRDTKIKIALNPLFFQS